MQGSVPRILNQKILKVPLYKVKQFLVSVENKNIYLLFYFDNMFRPTAHHQTISTKFRKICKAVQIIFL